MALELVERVPIFGALACETVCSQCFSSVLNLHFVLKVKSVIVDDESRAGWTGNVSLGSAVGFFNQNFWLAHYLCFSYLSAMHGSMESVVCSNFASCL